MPAHVPWIWVWCPHSYTLLNNLKCCCDFLPNLRSIKKGGLVKGRQILFFFFFFCYPSFILNFRFHCFIKGNMHVSFLLSEIYKDFLCGQTHGWFFWLSDGMGFKKHLGAGRRIFEYPKTMISLGFPASPVFGIRQVSGWTPGLKTRTSPGFCPTALEEELRGTMEKPYPPLFYALVSTWSFFFIDI